MREATMSPELFVSGATKQERARPADPNSRQPAGWDPEGFAQEQIRGLVRQVFLSNPERSVRQVVFSAAEPETDVQNLCWRAAEALAQETTESIALAGTYSQALPDANAAEIGGRRKISATRVRDNLWLVSPAANGGDPVTTAWLQSYLGDLRTQFEYSIVVGPSASESNPAAAMAQLADGIVLVLSAQHTRRIAARKIKEKLEGVRARLLGTVLSDRAFPIPERIYRRL